jgi:hypothetical protein
MTCTAGLCPKYIQCSFTKKKKKKKKNSRINQEQNAPMLTFWFYNDWNTDIYWQIFATPVVLRRWWNQQTSLQLVRVWTLVPAVYSRHYTTFFSKCQILGSTVYCGGSGKNWHFAIHVRNPDWKQEFTGTIFAIIPVTAETQGSTNACLLRVCPTKNAYMLLFHDRARRNTCRLSPRISQNSD